MASEQLLRAEDIAALTVKLAEAIACDMRGLEAVALVGIRSRGEILAQRLQRLLHDRYGMEVELGTLDITLYRDDLNQMGSKQPRVQPTEISFAIDNKLIILVDDVIHTGRSTRAAMDALIDFGRPREIRLAALIDRNFREFPIQPNYVGKVLQTRAEQRVSVHFAEKDGCDEVTLE